MSASVAEIRTQMLTAQTLARGQQAFVVIPVFNREEYVAFTREAIKRIEQLAEKAEEADVSR